MLKEVQDTYRDVRRLEASIIELHKMFMDLALLVDQQGEMLDQIEYQVGYGHNQVFRVISCLYQKVFGARKIVSYLIEMVLTRDVFLDIEYS